MNIRQVKPEGALMDRLLAMSAAWKAERNAHGYCANGQGAFEKCEVFVAEKAGEAGMGYVMLSTAAKEWKRILRFYTEELGMAFWTARLFKRL